ncbi:MAG: GT2 family glycosyltransferase [Cellvibrionaceae bacterium]|jgi:GT2 family glycosyltransferase
MNTQSLLTDTIGIVAIARNEGERLKDCLQSLHAAAPQSPIIYVDSGSTDGSVEYAHQIGVGVIELDTSIPFTAARARNSGAKKLLETYPEIQFIQFLDGDCQLQPQWLSSAIEFLEKDKSFAVVCGRRRELYPEASLYNALIDDEWNTPVGEALACGGDALYRRDQFVAVGGFDDTIIAGEEPELCYRLRQSDWKIQRIDEEMTLHDADLHHFPQWWRRAKRYGHAAFEAAWRYGREPERYYVRDVCRILLWALAVPLLILLLIIISPRWGWLSLAVYPLQIFRLYLGATKQGIPSQLAFVKSWTMIACKFAELLGGLRFLGNRLLGKKNTLIEYKTSKS